MTHLWIWLVAALISVQNCPIMSFHVQRACRNMGSSASIAKRCGWPDRYGETSPRISHQTPFQYMNILRIRMHRNDADDFSNFQYQFAGISQSIEEDGVTPIMIAADNGMTDEILRFSMFGADVNAHDDDGWTAMMYAADSGHVHCIELLAKLQADVNARSHESVTAVMIAAGNGHYKCIAALASLGADMNACTDCGVTALMLAAATGHADCVTTLRKLGANVHAWNNEGWTALRFAIHNVQPECIYALGFRSNILSPWKKRSTE